MLDLSATCVSRIVYFIEWNDKRQIFKNRINIGKG